MSTYDLVLYGASGFTGHQAAAYLDTRAPAGLRWAIAGRDRKKLEAVARALPSGRAVEVEVADALDAAAIDALVRKTRTLITTAGPYAQHGDHLVDACVAHGAHYADITGETPWVRRLIDRHHAAAASRGTRIVPCCGYDSVPSDLGAFAAVRALREGHGQGCAEVRAVFSARGGVNGGTVASALGLLANPDTRRALLDPVLLNPDAARTDAERRKNPEHLAASFDETLQRWTAPFFMAPINTRVVRRSAALHGEYGESYGATFHYTEMMQVRSRAEATSLALGTRALFATAGVPLWPWLIRKIAPAPGEGPSQEQRDGGFFRTVVLAEGDGGARVRVDLGDQGDPGNKVTVKILCEAGLALATQAGSLPGGPARGGLLTPATAFGEVLIQRLRDAGMRWTTQPAAA